MTRHRFEIPASATEADTLALGPILDFSKSCFTSARGSHDWGHTERVVKLCLKIAEVENADREVLAVAALLHDVGRSYEDASKGLLCHAEKGAEIAEAYLQASSLPLEKKRNIVHCIRAHRYRSTCTPETLEAKVLYDADKLDAIGAVGIARAFQFAGEVGATLHVSHTAPEETSPYSAEDTGYREFKLKLSKVKDRMMTEEGRRIAADRHAFMESFFRRFLEEVESAR